MARVDRAARVANGAREGAAIMSSAQAGLLTLARPVSLMDIGSLFQRFISRTSVKGVALRLAFVHKLEERLAPHRTASGRGFKGLKMRRMTHGDT
jgi:hypothetical protein